MPILPAGNIKARHKLKQAGFTLVEVMVVLLIVGLMAGTVVMNLPPKEDPLYAQGKLLATRMEMAAQSSLTTQTSIGVRFEEGGYEFVKYSGEVWESVAQYTYELEQKPNVVLKLNGSTIDIKEAQKSEFPVLRYDVTGLATPFEFSLEGSKSRLHITGGVDGSVTVKLGDET